MSVDRILSKKDLKLVIPYSSTHIARLEAAGRFPKRLRLGVGRVGWLESEVTSWQDALKRVRDHDGASK